MAGWSQKFSCTLAQLSRQKDASVSVLSPQSVYVRDVRMEVKQRLLLIPIVFILLRMWGTIQFFYSLANADQNNDGCIPKTAQKVFYGLAIVQV